MAKIFRTLYRRTKVGADAAAHERFRRNCEILLAGTGSPAGQVKVANPVVRRTAVPHAPLRVEEQFPNRIFRVRERIFGNLAGFRVQSAEHIHVIRRVPDIVIRIDTNTIWEYVLAAGQVVFLERLGFRTELTRATGDGGIDIVAVLDRPIVGGRYIVQCKRFGDKSPIGAPMIREFYGAFVSDRSAVKGLFITTSSFTAQAEEFARPLPIELTPIRK